MKKILETLKRKWAEYLMEIIVIMIGILGAFGLNNWNENQLKKQELNNIFKTIKSNLDSDILSIDEEIIEANYYLTYWQSLLENTDNDSLASLYIKNITLRFIPIDNAGYLSAISNDNIGLISNINFKSNLISYYGIDFANHVRFTEYLSDLARDLTSKAIDEAILVKSENIFGKRMTVVLKNPAFIEMTSSYLRLSKIVLERLEGRKVEAQKLIIEIDQELEWL